MKTHVLRTSIVALLLAVAGQAQSSLPLRANIPFNFVAGGATLNAGRYTVDQGDAGLITVKAADGKATRHLFAATVHCAGKQTASRLVFHRYGDTYLLSQIWTEGNNCGRQVPVTVRERTGGEGKSAGRNYRSGHAMNETVLRQTCEGLSQVLLIATASRIPL